MYLIKSCKYFSSSPVREGASGPVRADDGAGKSRAVRERLLRRAGTEPAGGSKPRGPGFAGFAGFAGCWESAGRSVILGRSERACPPAVLCLPFGDEKSYGIPAAVDAVKLGAADGCFPSMDPAAPSKAFTHPATIGRRSRDLGAFEHPFKATKPASGAQNRAAAKQTKHSRIHVFRRHVPRKSTPVTLAEKLPPK